MSFYKITKIVRALWLAENSVYMRVCKLAVAAASWSSCLVFRALMTQAPNLKKFSSSKLDKFTLFTHSFVGWNMENRYKEGESIFLPLSWHFKRDNSVFCKTRGVGRILDGYANPRLLPAPLVFISGFANTENVSYCLNIHARLLITN